ncbi:MAG: hypothetical protein K2P17_05045 [Helicobacteraceae bacterium]|nr:hypothetical protein [Helicobacteraceae bacterium]
MRYLVLLLCPIFIFSFDFIFEKDSIYKLNGSEFSINDGILQINKTKISPNASQCNQILKSQSFKIIFDKNLNYYYHTNRFQHFKEDLIELSTDEAFYRAKVEIRDFKNCFLVVKNTEQKIMKTKSSAMLLDFNSLDSNNEQKIYFTCLKSDNYVF